MIGVDALHRLERIEDHEIRVARRHRPHAGDGGRLVDREARRVLDQHGVEDAAALGRLGRRAGGDQRAEQPGGEHERTAMSVGSSSAPLCAGSVLHHPTRPARYVSGASRPNRSATATSRTAVPPSAASAPSRSVTDAEHDRARRRSRGRTASGRRSSRPRSSRTARRRPRRRPAPRRSCRRPCSTPRTRRGTRRRRARPGTSSSATPDISVAGTITILRP